MAKKKAARTPVEYNGKKLGDEIDTGILKSVVRLKGDTIDAREQAEAERQGPIFWENKAKSILSKCLDVAGKAIADHLSDKGDAAKEAAFGDGSRLCDLLRRLLEAESAETHPRLFIDAFRAGWHYAVLTIIRPAEPAAKKKKEYDAIRAKGPKAKTARALEEAKDAHDWATAAWKNLAFHQRSKEFLKSKLAEKLAEEHNKDPKRKAKPATKKSKAKTAERQLKGWKPPTK